jgi:hypothetical protein
MKKLLFTIIFGLNVLTNNLIARDITYVTEKDGTLVERTNDTMSISLKHSKKDFEIKEKTDKDNSMFLIITLSLLLVCFMFFFYMFTKD